jgi:hypothetical protein
VGDKTRFSDDALSHTHRVKNNKNVDNYGAKNIGYILATLK